MKTRRNLFVVLLFLTILIFYQCGNNRVVPDMCFKKNILPIFVSKCTTSGCHSGNKGKRNEGSNFANYEGIMTKVKARHPLLSEVYTQCDGSNPSMPPRGYTKLTKTELEYIKYWIHTGAKNSECGNDGCDTLNTSFTNRIQPILTIWCVGCHNKSNTGGGFDLSDYQGVKNCIPRLMGSLNQLNGYAAMPKGSSTPIGLCDLRAIQKWVDAGFPNN